MPSLEGTSNLFAGYPQCVLKVLAVGVEGTCNVFQRSFQRVSEVLAACFRGSPQCVFGALCNVFLCSLFSEQSSGAGLHRKSSDYRCDCDRSLSYALQFFE